MATKHRLLRIGTPVKVLSPVSATDTKVYDGVITHVRDAGFDGDWHYRVDVFGVMPGAIYHKDDVREIGGNRCNNRCQPMCDECADGPEAN